MSNNPKLATEQQVKDVSDTFTEIINHQGKQIKALESGVIDAIEPSSPAPTKRGEYKVTKVGVYINFKDGNGQPISVTEEDYSSGNVSIIFNGTDNRKLVVPITFEGKLKEGDTRGISGNEVFKKGVVPSDIGITVSQTDVNFLDSIINESLDNSEVFGKGYLNEKGMPTQPDSDWVYNLNAIEIEEGPAICKWTIWGNAKAIVVDKDNNILQIISKESSVAETLYEQKVEYKHGAKGLFLSINKIAPANNHHKQSIYYTDDSKHVSSDVFLMTQDFNETNITSKLTPWGHIYKTPLDNYIEELRKSKFSDDKIWKKGYYNEFGKVIEQDGWVCSILPLLIPANKIGRYFLFLTGNAHAIITDYKNNIVQKLTGSGLTPFETVKDAKFLFISMPTYQDLNRIYVKFEGYNYLEYNSDYLPKSDYTPQNIANTFNPWGSYYFLPQHNFFKEIVTIPTSSDFWLDNTYLNDKGILGESDDYVVPKDYLLAPHGEVNILTYMGGNAAICFYNKKEEVVFSIKNDTGKMPMVKTIEIPDNVVYCKPSFQKYYASKWKEIFMYSNEYLSINLNESSDKDSHLDFLSKTFNYSENYPIITFIADDFAIENMQWYKDKLDNHNIKSTFAVITDRIKNNDQYLTPEGKRQFANIEELLLMHSEGHDIAGHTELHPKLSEQDPDRVLRELRESSSYLRSLRNDIKARMFIAPYGSANVDVTKVIDKYYDTNFISGYSDINKVTENINQPPINRLRIKRVSFDAGTVNTSQIDPCKKAVDYVKEHGGWLVFAVHPQYPEYLDTNSINRKSEFDELINYIKSKEINIMTAQQAFDIYKNKLEINSEFINPNDFYAIGMDGSTKAIK